MKVGLRFTVACGVLVAFAAGCTCMQKPWGYGALGGGVVGAVGGGIATGAASNNTGAFDIGNDNEDKALAVATGRPLFLHQREAHADAREVVEPGGYQHVFVEGE